MSKIFPSSGSSEVISIPSRPSGEAHVPLAMSVLLYTGGGLAYYKRRSVPSLVAGVVFGTGYAISSWLISTSSEKQGHFLSVALSSSLATVMGVRFYRSRKMFPPGVFTLVGSGTALYHTVKLNQWLD